ncbi:MAG: hypothetical protein ABI885_18925 [Gammaproteobacteria bacterium]
MTALEIRSGLRKLEFEGASAEPGDAESERALVEFVREEPLPETATVRVELGRRNGVLREVLGRPLLLETLRRKGKVEYYYRLQGPIERAETR